MAEITISQAEMPEKTMKKGWQELLARIVFVAVSIAVIALISVTVLVPRIINPVTSPILLHQTVELTGDNYDAEFPLRLDRGERIDVKVSGDGQPVDFTIVDKQSFLTLVEKRNDTFYDYQWIVPIDGVYVFSVSASSGDVKATIIVAKAWELAVILLIRSERLLIWSTNS
jgi:hypothetical protein